MEKKMNFLAPIESADNCVKIARSKQNRLLVPLFVILKKLNFQKHYYIGKSCFALVFTVEDDKIVVRI